MSGSRENPAAVARWFREESGLVDVDRIDPEVISEQRGIHVEPIELDGLWGAAMVREGNAGILINSRQYPPRYRFTYAHELGHILLPQHYQILAAGESFFDEEINQRSPADDLEAEANAFAAELLAPAGRVRLQLRTGDLDIAAACRIQEAFDLSLTAAAVRMVDVTPQDLAVLRFNGDRLRWKYAGDDFPYGVPWKDWQAPPRSATADVIAGKGDQKNGVEARPQSWFVEREWGEYPSPLLESCVRLGQTGGYITMLWVP